MLLSDTEREETRKIVAVFCFSRTINTPAHTSSHRLSSELPHRPSYSLDLAHSAELKEFMKGRKFVDDEDVILTASGWLEDQDQEFFYSGIQALEKCWAKCISVGGDYVESDKVTCA